MAVASSVKSLGDQLEISIQKEAEHRTQIALEGKHDAVFKLLDAALTKEFGPNHGMATIMVDEVGAMFSKIIAATYKKSHENLTRSAVRNLTDSLTNIMRGQNV